MREFHYASFWHRCLAIIIDNTITILLGGIAGGIGGIGIGIVLAIILILSGMNEKHVTAISVAIAEIIADIIFILIIWLYFTILESSPWQATLGKKICKLKVTNMEGQRLSFARSNGRFWSKCFSNSIFWAGYIMVAFTKKKQALHDKIAGTIVLREVE